MTKLFAAYKGDLFMGVGTKQELADQLGTTLKTIKHCATPSYHKKAEGKENWLVIIKLDEDE